MTTRAGFIAIIGAPNAGKSTFMNQVVGEKISIVTPKVQTTRFNVRGIVSRDDSQLVFVDTPGVYKPGKSKMDQAMVASAWSAVQEADAALFVLDAKKGFGEKETMVLEGLRESRKPIFLALNKVDTLNKDKLLPLMQRAGEFGFFKQIFAISAEKGDGTNDVLDALEKEMPESPFLFDPDDITDIPMRMMAAEITREKAYMLLGQELPYAMAVETVNYEVRDNGSIRIDQMIYVKRDSQKQIVVGKGGEVLKKIGSRSRRALMEMMETDVHLFLRVKVKSEWSENTLMLRMTGFDL
ncbi:MAG: GTPase Era [Pseudomonadota bacterium]|nr:GTPase Era [Pseudomonadota bacterium]